MTKYQIQNRSDKAIGFTLVRKVKTDDGDKVIKEDVALYPGELREMAKLAGAHIDFHVPVDFTFRQKKAVSEKFTFINKTMKDIEEKVTAVDLPPHFTLLKIKKVHV